MVRDLRRARGVADPARGLYAAFSLQRGAIGKYLAPGVALAGMRAMLRGNGVGKPVGDVRTMPGLYLVEGTQVRWAQSFDHIGQRPDLRGVLAALRADRAE